MNFSLHSALCRSCVALAAASGLACAWAQTVAPDAGSLRQQIEQPRQLPALPRAPAPAPVPTAPPPAADGTAVLVRSFAFSGQQLLSQEQLQQAVAEYTGRELTFAQLQRALDAVVSAYRRAGWLATAFLPEQDLEGGIVRVQVLEARFAGVRLDGAAPRRVLPEVLTEQASAGQQQGGPLSLTALDRALLLADDLPGVGVAGVLEPGDAQGDTRVLLQTNDEPAFYGDFTLDNAGSRSTGSGRQLFNATLVSPGGRGELVSLNLLRSEGSEYGRVALNVPDGVQGLRLGVNASAMNYRVITGLAANSSMPIRGQSSSLGLEWSRPWLREREHTLTFVGGFDRKLFFNEDSQVRSDYRTDALRLGLSANGFDALYGGGSHTAQLLMVFGRLGDVRAHTLDQNLVGPYRKLVYSAVRQQSLAPAHTLLLSLQGQHATQLLDSSEKFFIGGASSVRAYPSNELGGDRGQQVSAEWRWRLQARWTLSAFADWGRVVALPVPSLGPPVPKNTYALSGRGLAASWQGPSGLTARLTWATRNGANPRPTSTGTDGDGSLRLDRLWASLSWAF